MNRTLLVRLGAGTVAAASLAAICLQLAGGGPSTGLPRPTEADLLAQADHDGMRFLMHFDGGDWRSFSVPVRAVWSTIRFEVQATAFGGAGLVAADPLAPTPTELIDAYGVLGIPEAEPVLTAYEAIPREAAAIAAWRGSFLALSGRIAERRHAYLEANLPAIAAAAAR